MARDSDIDFRQWVLLLFVVLLGGGLTWSATSESVRSAQAEARASFNAAADLYADRVKGALSHGLDAASDLYSYYEATEEIDHVTFQRLISSYSSLNEHRKMVGVAVAATPDTVGALEAYAKEHYPGEFSLRGAGDVVGSSESGRPGSGAQRAFYMLYVWAPNEDRAERWRGVDIGAYTPLNAFLEETLEKGQPAAIPMPPLETEDRSCVLLATPFVSQVGVDGVIIQILDMPKLLDEVASSQRFSRLNARFSSSWRGGAMVQDMMIIDGTFSPETFPPPAAKPWIASHEVAIGGQMWQVQPWAPYEAYRIDYGAAVITASVCLIMTGLVVFIVWSQSQRAKRVVDIVNRRTRALKEAHDELEDHYRMLQNLNRDVEEARKSAETANRAKSEFLATMSHELRTPLNAILGFSQILQEQALGPLGDNRYAEYAKDINASGSHLLAIINDILDLAKLEAGKIQIEQKRLSSRLLVDRVIALLVQQASNKGIELKAEFAMNMPDHILGDELRLRQILINLGSNAIKFTNQGTVVFRLHPRPFATGQAGWILEVEDTGIGIPEEKQATLFDRFTQVDAALSRRHGGVGLGLAICRELVDHMEGAISVRSIPNVGTTIRVHLPLMEADPETDDDGMI
ncbi:MULTISPECIES: ATP-binding protein [Kordiimonas]|uniref:ATP-binding protein n=1 Tax=Kordiimonas TaxID=288021 RepID=UPI00257B90B1|nr:ATP-binding protein [Kordiimonas sp. UBA4487]